MTDNHNDVDVKVLAKSLQNDRPLIDINFQVKQEKLNLNLLNFSVTSILFTRSKKTGPWKGNS